MTTNTKHLCMTQHLKQRLISRNTDNEAAITRRLQVAAEEVAYGTADGNFDAVIVNDDLETAYTQLRNFLDPLLKQSEEGS